MSDFSRDKLKAAAWAFMIKQNPIAAEHSVGFAIIHGQIKSPDFADAVWATRVEWRGLPLWNLTNLAKHLTGSGEVEFALGLQLPQGRKNVMSPIDVCRHGGETIAETFRHKTLSSQVITFIELYATQNVEN